MATVEEILEDKHLVILNSREHVSLSQNLYANITFAIVSGPILQSSNLLYCQQRGKLMHDTLF